MISTQHPTKGLKFRPSSSATKRSSNAVGTAAAQAIDGLLDMEAAIDGHEARQECCLMPARTFFYATKVTGCIAISKAENEVLASRNSHMMKMTKPAAA